MKVKLQHLKSFFKTQVDVFCERESFARVFLMEVAKGFKVKE